jgi:multidrug efflux pump subunit AcrA (membrane-fusion protein)
VDPLDVDVVLPAAQYRDVKANMIAKVSLGMPVNATLDAKVDAIDPVIDAASGTFRVRLALPNPDNAIPAGLRCTVQIEPPAGGS